MFYASVYGLLLRKTAPFAGSFVIYYFHKCIRINIAGNLNRYIYKLKAMPLLLKRVGHGPLFKSYILVSVLFILLDKTSINHNATILTTLILF